MSPELQIEALEKQMEGTTDYWERRDLQNQITDLQKQIEQAKEAEAKAAGQEKGAQQEKGADQEQSKEPGHRIGAESEADRAARLEAEQKAQQAEKDAAGKEKEQEAGKATAQEKEAQQDKAADQERQAEPEKAKEAAQEQGNDQDKGKTPEADQERDQARENSIEGADNELSAGRDQEGGTIDHGHRVLERTLGGNEGRVYDHEMTAEERKAEADLQAEWQGIMEKERGAELATHDPAERQQNQSPFADGADRNRAEAEAPAAEQRQAEPEKDLQQAEPEQERKAEAEKEQPRELEAGERVSGEVVGEYQDDNGRSHYEIETSDGERVGVPKDPDGPELEKGDDVTAERDERGNYEVQEDYSYGR